MPVKFILTPSESNKYSPPLFLSTDDKTLFPLPSIVIEEILGLPPPILLFILAELSKSISILAGTSPSPDPGGTGLEFAI